MKKLLISLFLSLILLASCAKDKFIEDMSGTWTAAYTHSGDEADTSATSNITITEGIEKHFINFDNWDNEGSRIYGEVNKEIISIEQQLIETSVVPWYVTGNGYPAKIGIQIEGSGEYISSNSVNVTCTIKHIDMLTNMTIYNGDVEIVMTK